MPVTNEPDIRAPKAATASAPPVCLPALNSPPASPAWAAGSESSSRNVSDGSVNPSPAPVGKSAASSAIRPGRNSGRNARSSIPSVPTHSPPRTGTWCPYRAATLADTRLASVSRPVIGRNSRPAVIGGSPRIRWKYRLSTNATP
jgi:hypothetical protein